MNKQQNKDNIKQSKETQLSSNNLFKDSLDTSLKEGQQILENINREIIENNKLLKEIIQNNQDQIEVLEKDIEEEKQIANRNKSLYEYSLEEIKVFESKIIEAEKELESIQSNIDLNQNNPEQIKKINELDNELKSLKNQNDKDLKTYKNNIENFFFFREKK